jgi:hypothetical protein
MALNSSFRRFPARAGGSCDASYQLSAIDACDPKPCPTSMSTTADLTDLCTAAQCASMQCGASCPLDRAFQPAATIQSGRTEAVACSTAESGWLGTVTLGCQAEQLTVVANSCRSHNPCDSFENDCLWRPGCSHTGPGAHSCECPPRFYGDGLDAGGGCDRCPAHSNTHLAVDTNGDGAVDTLTREACSCDAGYWTGAMAGGIANQLLAAGGSEVCAAAPCPSGSRGPGGGLTNGCPCSLGYYYAGASAAPTVRDLVPAGRLSALRVPHSESCL